MKMYIYKNYSTSTSLNKIEIVNVIEQFMGFRISDSSNNITCQVDFKKCRFIKRDAMTPFGSTHSYTVLLEFLRQCPTYGTVQ